MLKLDSGNGNFQPTQLNLVHNRRKQQIQKERTNEGTNRRSMELRKLMGKLRLQQSTQYNKACQCFNSFSQKEFEDILSTIKL